MTILAQAKLRDSSSIPGMIGGLLVTDIETSCSVPVAISCVAVNAIDVTKSLLDAAIVDPERTASLYRGDARF